MGFFFTICQKYWEMTDQEKALVPKKKHTKAEALYDHYHLPEQLKKGGFSYIFN